MNKKGMDGPVLVGLIGVVIFFVAISFAIIPKWSGLVGWVSEHVGFDFGTEEKTTDQLIDEERIDAGTKIEINTLSYDQESGGTIIIKQAYGQGWNLEIQETVFQTFSEHYTGPGWLLLYLTSGEEKPAPIVPNKKLEDILSSCNVRGSISSILIAEKTYSLGKTYVHARNKEGNTAAGTEDRKSVV